ncbi:MAG: zf-HC2 domain-containing protein [Calditrichaeota bacterium]|nr:zf-HC2 domain-containing protein [Calditrichota bacterium]
MKSCKFEKLLPDYLQDELASEAKRQLEVHLETCEHCTAKLGELADIHQILSSRQRQEPGKELMRDYRNYLRKYFPGKLSPVSILKRSESWWNDVFHSQHFTLRIAKAVALIIVGVFIGKFIFVSSVQAPRIETVARARMPGYAITPADLKLMNDYFVKSEILLLAIENWQGDTGADSTDLLFDKKIAQNLLLHSQVIRHQATQLYDSDLISFLNRMELLLLEISNVDNEELFTAFKEAKKIIKETDLLQFNKQFQNLFVKSELNNI